MAFSGSVWQLNFHSIKPAVDNDEPGRNKIVYWRPWPSEIEQKRKLNEKRVGKKGQEKRETKDQKTDPERQ